MQATHVTELLSPFLDDALDERERERVLRHLDGCAECRGHLASLRRTLEVVRSLDPAKVPDGFRAAVRARLEAGAAPVQPRRWQPRWSWPVALAAAAVVIVGVFSANLFREIRPPAGVEQSERAGPGLAQAPSRDLRSTGPAAPSPSPQALTAPGTEMRKIVRTAQLGVEVDQFDVTAQRLVQIAEASGGFVTDSSYAEEEGVPTGTFTLRVPAARFGSVMQQVERLGTVTQRQISGSDVTEEFIDVQARIRNLQRHEQRLLSFMDRATKVSDLLAIEEELSRVRGEIEQLTGRLRFLERGTDLATITVAVKQKAKKSSGALWDISGTLSKMRAAFLATLRQIASALEWLAVAASALAPVVLVATGAWFLIRRVRPARS